MKSPLGRDTLCLLPSRDEAFRRFHPDLFYGVAHALNLKGF